MPAIQAAATKSQNSSSLTGRMRATHAMRQVSSLFLWMAVLGILLDSTHPHVEAFAPLTTTSISHISSHSSLSTPRSPSSSTTTTATTTRLYGAIRQTAEQKARRKELLKREGNHFQIDRFGGMVEFGAAVNLVTELEDTDANQPIIETWLAEDNGRGLALSIWEEDLLTDQGNGVFRLQTMPLQFVTLQLQPAVDVQMWTQRSGKNKAGRLFPPIFKMQSLGFEPNLEILPGMSITAESLGLILEVVGDLRPTVDGKGVTGKICFQSKGVLPPPLRLVPESALKLAADTINDTVVQFAIASFQKGARQKYADFKDKQAAAVAKELEPQASSYTREWASIDR